jgi:outer membrane protein OmpA-like peptidoglycan-associated protein
MTTLRKLVHVFASSSTLAAFACASTLPPPDLVTARQNYDRASMGPAPQTNPADMHEAKKQLDVAEASFVEDGDTQETRDQAYLAIRKTDLAVVKARTQQAHEARMRVVNAMHADERRTVALTAAELSRTKNELAAHEEALKNETTRRQEAEKRAAQAAADLAKFATVKQEARGMVITLSGAVLFETAKADLLPAAQLKLNDVATALTQEDPLSKIVVEGHTDSQGAADYNQELSQRRAQTVRDYLVSRGIASDRITAQGFGFSRPMADNKSPEGRANNRRVEIVVQPVTQTQ